jgi:hypothetical protein
VVGYNPMRQRQLLDRIGLGKLDFGTLTGATLAAIGAMLALLAFALPRLHRERADPIVRAYRGFCRKLERAGCTRRPEEGPLDFATRVAREQPRLRPAVARITDHYLALRSGRARDPAKFFKLVKRFSIV